MTECHSENVFFPNCREMSKRPKAFAKGVCSVFPHSSMPCQLASQMLFEDYLAVPDGSLVQMAS